MKRKNFCYIFLIVYFLFFMSIVGCESVMIDNSTNEGSMIVFYTLEDFEFVKIGESTFYDVSDIVPSSKMQVTSYGGKSEYPMSDGGYICIKYCGKNLFVESVDIIYK